MSRTLPTFAILAWLCCGPLTGRAHAQDPPSEDARARAAEHFDRGIRFYNEERYDAALAELARAHELAPAHQTLYNLARVHAALGHAVESARAYAEYIEQAGEQLSPRRLAEATNELEEQQSRIGQLQVLTDVSGATIAVDGVDVATTPLNEPINLSAGAHIVEVHAPGREAVRRAVAIAGRSETRLEVELREEVIPRGSLMVTSSVPETEISIDSEPIGLTPLRSTLPLRAGEHIVRARRLGYRDQSRQIQIEEGAEAELHFEMHREPAAPPEHLGRLRLRLPDAPFLVRINGESMLGVDLELPVGAHVVAIEVTDRRPYEGTIRIEAASNMDITPPLTWTLEARRAQQESSNTQRLAGISLTAVGGAIAVAGVSVLVWNEAEITRTDDRIRFIADQLAVCRMTGFDRECEMLEAEGQALIGDQDSQNTLRGLSIAGTILGTAVAATGLALWLSSPSDEDIDAGARARLRVGPGGLTVDGTF